MRRYKKKSSSSSILVNSLPVWNFDGWDLWFLKAWSIPEAHWISYESEHMYFVLDLGNVELLRLVSIDFFHAQPQSIWNLLVLPKVDHYATSAGGVDGELSNLLIRPIRIKQ